MTSHGGYPKFSKGKNIISNTIVCFESIYTINWWKTHFNFCILNIDAKVFNHFLVIRSLLFIFTDTIVIELLFRNYTL